MTASRPERLFKEEAAEKPHWLGHRKRVRQHLFASGAEALQDYKLLELLLGAALPRLDVKPLAKKLLHEFKDLWALLRAPDLRLRDSCLGERTIRLLRATGAVALGHSALRCWNAPCSVLGTKSWIIAA